MQVDSTEAIAHLEAAAERALAKLQSGWLAGFLASSAGVRLMADVAAGTEADYSALPTVGGATWLEQFESAVEGLPFACCAADMQQPGARLVCVNGAFERLTGYGRDFAVGRNCRFLQGADTEPAAVQQLVEALRDARPTAVELTNYRRDGSAFRNALSSRW